MGEWRTSLRDGMHGHVSKILRSLLRQSENRREHGNFNGASLDRAREEGISFWLVSKDTAMSVHGPLQSRAQGFHKSTSIFGGQSVYVDFCVVTQKSSRFLGYRSSRTRYIVYTCTKVQDRCIHSLVLHRCCGANTRHERCPCREERGIWT